MKISTDLNIRVLADTDTESLEAFCRICARLGYNNNSSFRALKLNEILPPYGQYWVVTKGDDKTIVGISGCHRLDNFGKNVFRLLFRGCILPQYQSCGAKGLSKKHFNSVIFRHTIPLQVEWATQLGASRFVLTTNSASNPVDSSGKMFKVDRAMHRVASTGVIKLIKSNYLLYGCIQNIWEINPKEFD